MALEQVRKDMRLSRRKFAELAGVSEPTLRSWVQGALPGMPLLNVTIRRLAGAGALNVTSFHSLFDSYQRTLVGAASEQNNSTDRNALLETGINEVSNQRAANPPPAAPEQTSPGPTLNPTSAGFDIQIKPPPDAERNDPVQVALHRRLQMHVRRLEAALPRISNTHAMLAAEFNDYRQFLTADLGDLDVASLWSVGTGIAEHIRAVDRTGSTAMIPSLEPDITAELNGLLHDHTAFILGFEIGRELHERVIKSREAAQNNPDMQAQTQAVLSPMASIPHLLANKARVLVEALVRALGLTSSATFELLASSSNTTRGSIVAFARVLHPILLVSEGANLAMLFAGHEHAEVLTAAVIYLRDNMPTVITLFAHDPQIADWLGWVIRRLHDLPEE